ncbi:type II toxin-antitoxin system VapC family toxin [Gilvimarinus sp. F26214L]|uniref:type II toxin-antitoxin system VapC family toxin n=1 Tax=Gilvimarinus sp. DZF01 TaxID=3461371 RepID=UPI0040459A62
MILVNLNVLLDVFQKREPHYRASAAVLERVVRREEGGALAAHAVTTAHYLISRCHSGKRAGEAVDWLLKYFEVAPVGRGELVRAFQLGWADFEDAVVAAAAASAACEAIITRNVKDFRDSPVAALTPEEHLLHSDSHQPNQIQSPVADYHREGGK